MRPSFSALAAFALLPLACAKPAPPASPPSGATERAAEGAAADRPGVTVGARAPAFSLVAVPGGERVSFPTGKVTLVVFWATWSEPDKKELIELQKILARNAAAGLVVIGVSVDDEDKQLAEFALTYGLRFPIVWDEGHAVANAYRPATDPSTYLVDAAGVIRHHHSGYHDGMAKEIEDEARALLAVPALAR